MAPENEEINQYPEEILDEIYNENEVSDNIIDEQTSEEQSYSLPPDFKYTPVEIPHKVDWFVLLLSCIIIGVLCYLLFATTSIFELSE